MLDLCVYWYIVNESQGKYWTVRSYDDRRQRMVDILREYDITEYEYYRDDNGFYLKFAQAKDAVLFRMLWNE